MSHPSVASHKILWPWDFSGSVASYLFWTTSPELRKIQKTIDNRFQLSNESHAKGSMSQ